MWVYATSTTTGTAVLENVSTGQIVSQEIQGTTPLVLQEVEWIIEDYSENGASVSLADWGTVTFTNTACTNDYGGQFDASLSSTIAMINNGDTLADASLDGANVVITST